MRSGSGGFSFGAATAQAATLARKTPVRSGETQMRRSDGILISNLGYAVIDTR
jgi:hypothetical protein